MFYTEGFCREPRCQRKKEPGMINPSNEFFYQRVLRLIPHFFVTKKWGFLFYHLIFVIIMKLTVTMYHASTSAGYTSRTENPVAIAFKFLEPTMENVEVHNNRLTATKEGFPIRFLIEGYTVQHHQKLLAGKAESYVVNLKALPIPISQVPQAVNPWI